MGFNTYQKNMRESYLKQQVGDDVLNKYPSTADFINN